MFKMSQFKKFLLNLFIIQLLVFTAIIGSFLFSGYVVKLELAQQMSKMVSSQFKMGNKREAVALLSDLQSVHFDQVSLYDSNNKLTVSFPTDNNRNKNPNRKFVLKEVSLPIYYDTQKKNLAGEIKFVFNFIEPLALALTIWLFGVAMTVPISFRYKKNINADIEIERVKDKNRAIKELAQQVRHDYKSPLQSIHCLAEGSQNLNQKEKRSLLRAVNRLKQIMNDLSKKNLESSTASKLADKGDQPLVHILSVVKEIIDEKKAKVDGAKNISFKIEQGSMAMSCYYLFKEADFQRVLSNLIDNSIEAISREGSVIVRVEKIGDELSVVIKDTGKGIETSLIKNIGKKGNSFGKEGGEGLGLYSAIQKVESWNGSLKLESSESLGTQVKISLPDVVNPHWAVETIDLNKWQRIDVLDDDSTVHDRWSIVLSSNKVKMSNFLDISSYFAWKKQSTNDSNCLNIIDFDLNDSRTNGIQVIQKMGNKNSILVTNNFCEKSIQDSVDKNNILMMPKSMMEMI